ncbi:Protein translocase membrane subunit SecG [hydrothermal vent metagenome]|uniref:Protein translocase membrane subunit SecG n=1 Tax=hydrothermal vent metagenome TaxID=652676 RepID=A0A3B0SK61_9ZZZZ
MQEIVLVIHLILTITLVVLVLIQKSSGGALGIGGGGGQGGMMAGRSSATLLTKVTTFLAVAFFVTSLGLAVIAKQQTGESSVFDVEEKVIEQTEPEDKRIPIIPDSE